MSQRLRAQALEVLIARENDLTPEIEANLRAAFAAGRLNLRADGKTLAEMTPCELEHLYDTSPALYLLMMKESA